MKNSKYERKIIISEKGSRIIQVYNIWKKPQINKITTINPNKQDYKFKINPNKQDYKFKINTNKQDYKFKINTNKQDYKLEKPK